LVAGDLWVEKLRNWLQKCDVLLSVVSRQSVTSDFVAAERDEALRVGKKIIPILAHDVKPPELLASIRWCDLRSVAEGKTTFQEAADWKLLLSALRLPTPSRSERSTRAKATPHDIMVFHHDDDALLADDLIELLRSSSLDRTRRVGSAAMSQLVEMLSASNAFPRAPN
jgi:hypothetical protein